MQRKYRLVILDFRHEKPAYLLNEESLTYQQAISHLDDFFIGFEDAFFDNYGRTLYNFHRGEIMNYKSLWLKSISTESVHYVDKMDIPCFEMEVLPVGGMFVLKHTVVLSPNTVRNKADFNFKITDVTEDKD